MLSVLICIGGKHACPYLGTPAALHLTIHWMHSPAPVDMKYFSFASMLNKSSKSMGVAQALESEMGALMEDNGKERSMCATLAEVRSCLAEVPEHMRWALNEVRHLLRYIITGRFTSCFFRIYVF